MTSKFFKIIAYPTDVGEENFMKNYEEERLKSEYAPKIKTNLDESKKIDYKAKLPAYIIAYTLGIIGSLTLGLGMCLAMKIIGDNSLFQFVSGIIIGIIGIIIIVINYPLFIAILRKRKARYASEILVILNNDNK